MEAILATKVDLKILIKRINWRKAFEIAPLVLFFLYLCSFAPILVLEKLSPCFYDYLHTKLVANLIGVQNPVSTRPTWSLKTWYEKEFQNQFEKWLDFNIPLRSYIIKIHNQLYYSLFSKSYMYTSQIEVGQGNYLFEHSYIQKYLNLDNTVYNELEVQQWISDLTKLKTFFEKRGQQFIYLITPSKASYYPEYFPLMYRYRTTETRPDYYIKIAALQKSQVPYVDGSKVILDAKSKYGKLLFPRGGTHWTSLGAALVTEKVLDVVLADKSKSVWGFKYTVDTNPINTDTDLLDLLNLLLPDKRYEVPNVVVTNSAHIPNKGSARVALIGGSFTISLLNLLAQTQYFDTIDRYNYLILSHEQSAKDGSIRSVPMNPNDPDAFKDILKADIVILEENEMFFVSNHFKEFYLKIFGTNQK